MSELKPEELKYRGVGYNKTVNRWNVFLKYRGKTQYLGRFYKLKDAVETYDRKAIEIWGRDAITNQKLIENGEKPPIDNIFDCPVPNVDNLEGEIWKDVVGFEGFYLVSNLGRIKSLPRDFVIEERIIKPRKEKKGYLAVRLIIRNLIRKIYKIHRLVAVAFIPNPHNFPQVNHKNMNKEDNRVENLEWINNIDNFYHAMNTNITNNKRPCGAAKLNAQQVKEIKELINNNIYSRSEIANKYDVHPCTISYIKNGKIWKNI